MENETVVRKRTRERFPGSEPVGPENLDWLDELNF
jgi:hypothetical protein